MRNPLYAFVAFLLVEALITSGFINKSDAPNVQAGVEDVIFYVALAITGLLGLHKYVDAHKHQVTKNAEVDKASFVTTPEQPQDINIHSTNTQVFTEASQLDAGTPPVVQPTQNEHIPGTNGVL
jgi:hypothetical protein